MRICFFHTVFLFLYRRSLFRNLYIYICVCVCVWSTSTVDSLSFHRYIYALLSILRTLLFINITRLVGRVFTYGSADRGSLSGQIIPKTQKMVLDVSLFKTQHYKARFKGKVAQPREKSSALSYTLVL